MVLLALFLMAAAPSVTGLTLYVKRVVSVPQGPLTVGDIVLASGDVTPELRESFSREIAEVSDRILLIPTAVYRGFFEAGAGNGFIFVGRRTLVVPLGSVGEDVVPLLDRLADYLGNKNGIGNGKVELELVRVTGAISSVPGAGLLFRVIREERKAGLLSGLLEIGFRPSGPQTNSTEGRVTLRIRQGESAGDAQVSIDAVGSSLDSSVRANDEVSVLFHKGTITIEMQGKAMASASSGDLVGVYIPESRLSFSGTVIGNKVVGVELP